MARRGKSSDQDLEAEDILAQLREAAQSGERHWFVALLEGVGRWPLAEEEVDGRTYRYLIGGEAFDWMLLAERLCAALADVSPEDERVALLSHGRFPTEVSEDAFRRLLGPAKYRAHLNFLYGVRVEGALQRRTAQEVEKEQMCNAWQNGHIDDEVCSRIYGSTRRELLARFQAEQGSIGDSVAPGDGKEFTYWLFKHRVTSAEPARVASDTRKGLAMLSRMRSPRR